MHRLPSRPGHSRQPRSSAFHTELDRWVRQQAHHFNVSKSFVIATCLSVVSGIEEADYRTLKPARRRGKVLRMKRTA